MNSLSFQVPNSKCLVVVEKPVKNGFIFLLWDTISFGEQFLDLFNTLANADGWLMVLILGKMFLEIRCCRQMICMSVRFKNLVDLIALSLDKRQQGVGCLSGHSLSGGIIVQNWIDDDSCWCWRVDDKILPCSRCGLEDIVNYRLRRYSGCSAVCGLAWD